MNTKYFCFQIISAIIIIVIINPPITDDIFSILPLLLDTAEGHRELESKQLMKDSLHSKMVIFVQEDKRWKMMMHASRSRQPVCVKYVLLGSSSRTIHPCVKIAHHNMLRRSLRIGLSTAYMLVTQTKADEVNCAMS